MAVSIKDAEKHCSQTEWNTVKNSFSPKLDELKPAVAKKHAARVQRFLEKATREEADKGKLDVLSEALERLNGVRVSEEDGGKLKARKEKEQAAREKARAAREHRQEVRTKLKEKAEEEKAEAEGHKEEKAENSGGGKPKKSGKRTQGRIGTRKV